MDVVIGKKRYTEIGDLSFEPSADITGTSLEINQFSCSIKTDDEISFGDFAWLYDERGKLWARYWITEVERFNEYYVTVTAQSMVLLLDRKTMPAKMYKDAPVDDVVREIFSGIDVPWNTSWGPYSEKINGFCPEQTARVRLQWVCLTIGAYVKNFFSDGLYILPVSDSTTDIPLSATFYRPSVTYNDFVTAVKVTAYSYREGTPSSTDSYVTGDEEKFYIESTQTFTLNNKNVPDTAAENVVEVNDVKLVNKSNASAIATRIAKYYFNRMQVDCDVLDGGRYLPGDRVLVNLDNKGHMAAGFISQASFSFGYAEKAKLTLHESDDIQGVYLIISDRYENTLLRKDSYYFPAGYDYSIENPYIETAIGNNKYVYIPKEEKTEGTMKDSETWDEAFYDIALKQEMDVLYIYSVDEMEISGDEPEDKELKIK